MRKMLGAMAIIVIAGMALAGCGYGAQAGTGKCGKCKMAMAECQCPKHQTDGKCAKCGMAKAECKCPATK